MMHVKIAIYLVLCCCGLFLPCDSLLIRQSLQEYPLALCTDGSPASYYHSVKYENQKNFIVFLQPGGYCHNVFVCKLRCSVAPFMCLPPAEDFLENKHGILSDDPKSNPHFSDYYKVVVPYCTADMYVGSRSASEDTGGFSFLGRYVLLAVIQSLSKYTGIERAENVVFAGSSAGGAGVAFNCDIMKQLLPGGKIWCVVDGAFYYPILQPFNDDPPCDTIDDVLEKGSTFWNAPDIVGFPLHSAWWENTNQPVFVSSAGIDQFGFESYCGDEDNDTEKKAWSQSTQEMTSKITKWYPHLGLFVPSCYDHMLLLDPGMFNAVPVGYLNRTLSDLLGHWVKGNGDIQAWDQCDMNVTICNKNCPNKLAVYEDFTHV